MKLFDAVAESQVAPKAWTRQRKFPLPAFCAKTGHATQDAGIIKEEISSFFDEIFKLPEDQVAKSVATQASLSSSANADRTARRLDKLPDLCEVAIREVMSHLAMVNLKTAPGPGCLVMEALVHAGPSLAAWLARALSWRLSGHMHAFSWQTLATTLIPKLSGPCLVTQFRPISVCICTQRLLGRILLSRLQPWLVDFDTKQCGGRTGVRGTDAQHSLHLLMSRAHEWKLPFHAFSLDIQKAYDRLPRWVVYEALLHRGVPPSLVEAVSRELEGVGMEVCFASMSVATQDTYGGVPRGRSESPALFVCALDYILQHVSKKWEREGRGFKLLGGITPDADLRCLHIISRMAYMDDLLLLASTKADATIMLQDVMRALRDVGMDLNLGGKCKWLPGVFMQNPGKLLGLSPCSSFKFLGGVFTVT